MRISKTRRSGVSLIEVLFSIGVASFGLIAAIALIPVAGRNLERGRIADSSAMVGEAAMEQIEIVGMRRVSSWRQFTVNPAVDANGNGTSNEVPNDAAFQIPFFLAWNTSPAPNALPYIRYDHPLGAFCLDPEFVAARAEDSQPRTLATFFDRFPYYSVTLDTPGAGKPAFGILDDFLPTGNLGINRVLTMPRITSVPGLNGSFLNGNGLNAAPALTQSYLTQAAEFCDSHDDLIFDKPPDSTFPAKQAYSPRIPPYKSRESREEFNWMATFVPEYDLTMPNPSMLPTIVNFRPTGTHRMSVAVFRRRRFPIPFNPDVFLRNDIDSPERVCVIPSISTVPAVESGFPGGGVTGGDVLLCFPKQAAGEVFPPTRVNDVLTVRIGDWVMLCADLNNPVGPSLATRPVMPYFQWYKIQSVNSEIREANVYDVNGAANPHWVREVSLFGPDWPIGLQQRPVQVVLVPDVVAVFEKSVSLEGKYIDFQSTNVWE